MLSLHVDKDQQDDKKNGNSNANKNDSGSLVKLKCREIVVARCEE